MSAANIGHWVNGQVIAVDLGKAGELYFANNAVIGLSATAVRATSQRQLDDLYRDITAHPLVVMAL